MTVGTEETADGRGVYAVVPYGRMELSKAASKGALSPWSACRGIARKAVGLARGLSAEAVETALVCIVAALMVAAGGLCAIWALRPEMPFDGRIGAYGDGFCCCYWSDGRVSVRVGFMRSSADGRRAAEDGEKREETTP